MLLLAKVNFDYKPTEKSWEGMEGFGRGRQVHVFRCIFRVGNVYVSIQQ